MNLKIIIVSCMLSVVMQGSKSSGPLSSSHYFAKSEQNKLLQNIETIFTEIFKINEDVSKLGVIIVVWSDSFKSFNCDQVIAPEGFFQFFYLG